MYELLDPETKVCFFFPFLPHPVYQVYYYYYYYLRPSILSPLVVTLIRGHMAGFSSPLPTTCLLYTSDAADE